MATIRVVTRRSDGTRATLEETTIYIGHPSVLGNPFTITKESNRKSSIRKHSVWLDREMTKGGPVKEAIEALVARVAKGECIALEC